MHALKSTSTPSPLGPVNQPCEHMRELKGWLSLYLLETPNSVSMSISVSLFALSLPRLVVRRGHWWCRYGCHWDAEDPWRLFKLLERPFGPVPDTAPGVPCEGVSGAVHKVVPKHNRPSLFGSDPECILLVWNEEGRGEGQS
jgi:hypothetical protein